MPFWEALLALTERDNEILATLTRRVKALSLTQVQGAWWPGATSRTVLSRMRQLESNGWLQVVGLPAKGIDFRVTNPLVPADELPGVLELRSLVAIARSRWQAPVRVVQSVAATRQAARYFGGHAQVPRPSEATHDLFLSAVYLRYLCTTPSDIESWLGERQVARLVDGGDSKVPDALLKSSAHGLTAVEVVGESYSATKLEAFQSFCSSRGWRCELW